MTYDALDRLVQTTLPDTTTEQTGYGVDDTVTSQTDAAGHTTTQTFNGFGEVLSRTSPDSGLTAFTRDANGNALTQTDARSKVLTTTYDALNRPLTQTGSTGGAGEQITWAYDTCTNGIGHVCTVTDRTGSTAFTYDRWGRVTSQTQVTHAHTFTTLYGYDTAGQLTTLTYPSGQVLTQTWTNGRVTGQQWGLAAGSGPAIFTGAQYDPWDKLLGWTWASGRAYSIAYDLDGRVSAVGTGSGTTKQTYAFDDAWRLTGITRQPAAATTTFGYDSRDRLLSGSTWGSYTYDGNSNRLTWLGTLGPQSYGMMLGTNRLATINATAVTTDAAGNLTSKPGLGLTFDDWSRLRTATASGTTTTYGVNGLNERVSKTDGATTWVYIYAAPGHLLGVYNGSTGAAVEELAYLGERPVATARSGAVYPIETDHLMAPLRVLDASNTVVWSWEDREPFGATAPTEGTVGGQPFSLGLRFPGQWADRESGLVSNGFRDYDPALGRYAEVDPLGLAAGMNVYAYVGGDPLGYTDPYGLSGFGFNAGGSAQGGIFNGGAAQANSGAGVFWGHGLNAGGYTASGSFSGHANDSYILPGHQDDGNSALVVGASAGLGVGVFYTNAESANQLLGVADTSTLNIGFISIQWAEDSSGTYTASLGFAKGLGFDFNRYQVTTTSAGTFYRRGTSTCP